MIIYAWALSELFIGISYSDGGNFSYTYCYSSNSKNLEIRVCRPGDYEL